MFKTVVLLSQMYVCITSGKSLISEVDKTLQEAAFSVTTVRPIGPVRWWRITDEPTTITWRYWRITKIITLLCETLWEMSNAEQNRRMWDCEIPGACKTCI